MHFKVRDIAVYLSGVIEGDGEAEISNIADIQGAKQGDLTFLSNTKYEPFLYQTKASAVIVSKGMEIKQPVRAALIRVVDPYSSFTKVLEMVEARLVKEKVGIEQPSFVAADVQLGEGVYVGAFAYIGSGARIGDHVKIYPNCYVGDDVVIGSNSILHPGASVHQGIKVGSSCVLHHGAVVGSAGFGFAPQPDGSYRRIPQLGTVILEDHVSIGANTTVDRATFEATVIKRGVKLDNLVQIAHNCTIGENTVMAAQVGLAGTTEVGARCQLGGQVGVGGHLSIADGTKIIPKGGVMSSIKEENQSWGGAPITSARDWLRISAAVRKLPDLIKQIQVLEKRLEDHEE